MGANIKDILAQYPNKLREDLIPLLGSIQEELGYLSEDSILQVSNHLSISVNKVYGVATFYDSLRFAPQGKFHIRVCNGTACKIDNSPAILAELQRLLKIKPNETDKEGLFSLEVVTCLGGCGVSPVVEINGMYYPSIKASSLKSILEKYRAKADLL